MADPKTVAVDDDPGDWVPVPAIAPPPATGASPPPATTSDEGWVAAPPPPTKYTAPYALPYNPNAPPAMVEPKGGATARGLSGLWSTTGAAAVDSAKALWDVINYSAGQKENLDPNTKAIVSNAK